jgi:hypothetical protein
MVDVNAHSMHRTVLTDIVERGTSSINEFDMKDGRATAIASRAPGMVNTPNDETVDVNQPAGVQQMEAITIVWTKQWLVIAYALSILTHDSRMRARTDYTQRYHYLLYQLTATTNEFRVRALGHELLPATWLDCYDKPGGQYRQRSVQIAAVQVH